MTGFKRKGVTPVIATVILITISVAATASAYTFITSSQEQVAEGFENQLTQQERESRSDLNVEYVYNSTGNFTFMNIRNTGSVTLPINESGQKLLTLYVDGRPVSSDIGSSGKGWKYDEPPQAPSDIVVLDPEDLMTINTTVTFPADGARKSFRLVGPYKTSDSHVCYNSGTASC